MISYDKCVELLSKDIVFTEDMKPKDYNQIKDFESNQPAKCPHCGVNVISPFKPRRIIHGNEICTKSVKSSQ